MHPNDDNAETTDEKTWDLTMQINVKGVWWGCKYGIPALRRAGGGSIINTASFVGILGIFPVDNKKYSYIIRGGNPAVSLHYVKRSCVSNDA